MRRLHASKSLGDGLNDNQTRRNQRRRSLGVNLRNIDKENEVTPSQKLTANRNSSTPLLDSSNLRRTPGSIKRKHHLISSVAHDSTLMSPISLNTEDIYVDPLATVFQANYAPTLPSFDVEYSPVMKVPSTYFAIPNEPSELPAKRRRLELLDLSYEFKPESASTSSPLSTPLCNRKALNGDKLLLNLSDSSNSFNSSECGDMTLQKMIDDILASAKNGKKFKRQTIRSNHDRNANFMKTLNEVCETLEQKSIEKLLSPHQIAEAAEKTIIIANASTKHEREVRSPMKCEADIVDLKTDDMCTLKRQNAVRRKNTSNENKNKKKADDSQAGSVKEFHDSSIQKCLSFSSADMSDRFKRSSVASNTSTSSGFGIFQSKYAKNLMMKGSLEMKISTDENRKKIEIHGECGKVLISLALSFSSAFLVMNFHILTTAFYFSFSRQM